MKNDVLQYFPLIGIPSAMREFDHGASVSVFEPRSYEESVRGVLEYAKIGFILPENVTVGSGLVYLCSKIV